MSTEAAVYTFTLASPVKVFKNADKYIALTSTTKWLMPEFSYDSTTQTEYNMRLHTLICKLAGPVAPPVGKSRDYIQDICDTMKYDE